MINLTEIQDVKDAIYHIETELIQQKKFQDEVDPSQPKFVTNLDIQNRLANLGLTNDEKQVVSLMKSLEADEFMKFDNILQIKQNSKIKFFVRSRTYHTIWTLYRTTNRTVRNGIQPDVADYQYIRHVKRSPKHSNSMKKVLDDADVKKNISPKARTLLEKVIDHIIKSKEIPYEMISNFQLSSAIRILKNLELNPQGYNDKTKAYEADDPGSIVIEAGTGFGKSWAYQLPLLLWILNKKHKKYNEVLEKGTPTDELHVNCSALLIFPRNALAEDQLANMSKAINVINEVIEKQPDSFARKFFKIKAIIPDFHGKLKAKQIPDKYGNNEKNGYPDIIIANAGQTGKNTLERRISDPHCYSVFKNGIDCILYDEVHLYDGIQGAEIASINARLQNLLQEKSKKFPLFVGMSATVDQSQLHCQKLFSLITKKKPIKINLQGPR